MVFVKLWILYCTLAITSLPGVCSSGVAEEYAILNAESSVNKLTSCFTYFPSFQKLPTSLDDSPSINLTYEKAEHVCNSTITQNIVGKIVVVDDGICGALTKAYHLENGGAVGLLVGKRSDNKLISMSSKNISFDEVHILIGIVNYDDNIALQNLGKSAHIRLYAVGDTNVHYSFAIIWGLAVFAVIVGSYWSGTERYKVYQVINNPPASARDEEADETEEDAKQTLMKDQKLYRTLNVSVAVVFGMVLGACTMLLLLYFFYEHLVKVLKYVFCIFLSFSFASLVVHFLNKVRFLRIRYSWKKLSITRADIIAFCIAVSLVIWWMVCIKASYAWVIQDMFGVSLIIVALKEIRMPSLKIITYLLVLLFIYDIFFVFITPFFMPSRHVYFFETGESIMVSVAMGKNGEELPITLKVPRFAPAAVKYCNQYSLLGFGDMLAPGLLLSYCHGFDLENGLRRIYFILSSVCYGIGLLAAFVALFLMNAAQPALLYLVPFTLIPVILTSIYRKEFKLLWRGVIEDTKNETVENTSDNSSAVDH